MSIDRRLQRDAVARRAAERLHQAERAIDGALHELGLLMAELPRLRQDAHLSAVIGQDVFNAVGAAVGAATLTREHLVTAHNGCQLIHDRLKLTAIPDAPGGDKPSSVATAVPLQAGLTPWK